MGTGYRFLLGSKSSLSFGINGGYMFGKKEYSTRRTLLNDTVDYYRANFESRTVYGNLHFSGGIQYRTVLNEKKKKSLTIGAFGNLGQDLNGKQDIIRETYFINPNTGNEQIDSVSIQSEVRGKIRYPGSFTIGFVYEKDAQLNSAGWLIGVDYVKQNWDDYRFYGQKDFVASKWEVRVGAQLRPVPKRNYFSNVLYRAGFFIGPDYVKVQKELPQFGATFGLGLPIANYRSSYSSLSQATIINLAFEFIKRGNDDNLLRENMFRFSVGFSVSDLWFIKRKYD
jgi:hypothetical protein